jgi:hypothetical protein
MYNAPVRFKKTFAVIIAAIMGCLGFRGRNEMPHIEPRRPVTENPVQLLHVLSDASVYVSSMTTPAMLTRGQFVRPLR